MSSGAARLADQPPSRAGKGKPRLGFLGVGWIGRARMQAMIESDVADVIAVADPELESCRSAVALAPGAEIGVDLLNLLEQDLDGLVIATPSALHAEQAIAALQHGVAVFCQKPLGRTAAETERVIAAARGADLLLGVDLSYRHTAAVSVMRERLAAGEIGRLYAADLVFHNAYGPDKPWFAERRLSGGGCLIDLGTHLVDLLLWLTDSTELSAQAVTLRRQGRVLGSDDSGVEDYAVAALTLPGDVDARLACSWFLHAGRECQIKCTLIGTEAALSVSNVNGSFYDLRLELRRGTSAETLVEPPDSWGGRALVEWARALGAGRRFDADDAAQHLNLARALDAIYSSGGA